MCCPKCKQEFPGKFCPECGAKLIEEAPSQNDINLNLSDKAAVLGGINVNKNETHNTISYDQRVINTSYVTNNTTKSDAQLHNECVQQFLELCKRMFSDGLLVEEEKQQLEAERLRLGIDSKEAVQLIEAARKSSGSRITTLGVRDSMTLANINTYIENNNAKVLQGLIPGLSAIARKYNVDEILCIYNMLLAALYPDKLISEYENNSADEYWQTYWAAIAYAKCDKRNVAEDTIVKLGYFSQYPDANSLLLSAVSIYSVFGVELAKGYVDAIIPEQCSSLLHPFIKALFLEMSPERAGEISIANTKCQFYTDYIVSLESPEEKKARRQAEEERKRKAEEERKRNAFETKIFNVKGISFKMVAVEGGTFNMGSNDSEAFDLEKPVHSVTLSDYYIGETEVTQELWEAVMDSNPSYSKGDKYPVEQVSYNDCIDFINKLNTFLAGQLPDRRKFRLPTEAQWEFAARGGNKGKNNNNKYSGSNSIDDVARYDDKSGGGTHPVKQKQPNELGLYDMTGNVWEWCSDWCGSYSSSLQTDPEGPSSGEYRVLRGGSWLDNALGCRVAHRSRSTPDSRYFNCGLRLAF